MNIKTVQQGIAEHSSYKASSLYATILKAIKSGGLGGKAIRINRNDANSKFRLPKTKGKTRGAGREVTNFVLINLPTFDVWFEASKARVRNMIALNKSQVVMPRLEEIVADTYTSKQLSELAARIARNKNQHRQNLEHPRPDWSRETVAHFRDYGGHFHLKYALRVSSPNCTLSSSSPEPNANPSQQRQKSSLSSRIT